LFTKTLCQEWGLKLTEKNTVDSLSLEQLRRIKIAEHSEQYIKQQQRDQTQHSDRPDSFGNVSESRAKAFQ